MKRVNVKIASHCEQKKSGKEYIEGALKAIFLANGADIEDEKIKLNIKKITERISINFEDYHDAVDLLGDIQSAILVKDSNPLKDLWAGFCDESNDTCDEKGKCEECCYVAHDDDSEEPISTMDFVMATKTFNSLLEYYSTDDEDVLIDADFCVNNFVKSMEIFNKLFRFYINH